MRPSHFLSILAAVRSAFACAGHSIEVDDEAELYKRSTPVPHYKKTAITNVHVFDSERGVMLPRQTVVIEGDKIGSRLDGVEKTINAHGGYLIPGLIDSHAHPVSVGHLEELSGYGVTTVLGMSCLNYTACQLLKNQKGLTNLESAGFPAVSPNSDHARVLRVPPSLQLQNASQAPEFVDWTFGNQSRYMKIISAEPNGLNLEEQSALVAETKKRGRQSMTHAAQFDPFVIAVKSGTNGIQHTPAGGVIDDSLLSLMKEQKQFLTATLSLIKTFLSNPDSPIKASYNLTSFRPAADNVRRVHEAGIPVLAGTDSVGMPNPLNATSQFGLSLHEELGFFVNNASFSPAEALRSATALPAELQRGLEDRGKIKPGMRADLVLLGSDPLCNISNTMDIKMVWIGGLEYRNVSRGN